jgi:hypothetical protein
LSAFIFRHSIEIPLRLPRLIFLSVNQTVSNFHDDFHSMLAKAFFVTEAQKPGLPDGIFSKQKSKFG